MPGSKPLKKISLCKVDLPIQFYNSEKITTPVAIVLLWLAFGEEIKQYKVLTIHKDITLCIPELPDIYWYKKETNSLFQIKI